MYTKMTLSLWTHYSNIPVFHHPTAFVYGTASCLWPGPEAMLGCFHGLRKLKEKLEKREGKQSGPAKYMEGRWYRKNMHNLSNSIKIQWNAPFLERRNRHGKENSPPSCLFANLYFHPAGTHPCRKCWSYYFLLRLATRPGYMGSLTSGSHRRIWTIKPRH